MSTSGGDKNKRENRLYSDEHRKYDCNIIILFIEDPDEGTNLFRKLDELLSVSLTAIPTSQLYNRV